MTEASPQSGPERFQDVMLDSEPEFEEVLICVFGMQRRETQTYHVLLGQPESTVTELTDRLDRDHSTIHRSLVTLCEKDLATRRRRLLDGGGHVYHYTATPLPEAIRLMHDTLDEWIAYVHSQIREFGKRRRSSRMKTQQNSDT